MTPAELSEMRNTVLTILDNPPELIPIVNKLSFAQCAYLLSVYKLETLRVIHSGDPCAFHGLFLYLEDKGIIQDKSDMWKCISVVAHKTFDIFLNVKAEMPKTQQLERELEQDAQFLLVNFNHYFTRIRRVADKFLSSLVEKFPTLLWSRKVLTTMLDILQILSLSLDMNPNDQPPEFQVPDTKYKLRVMSTMAERENTVKDFAARSVGILQESMRWAPNTTRSHLIEYLLKMEDTKVALGSHTGLALATESVLNSAGYSKCQESMGTNSSEKRQRGNKNDSSNFMANLSIRSRYLGEIEGMRLALTDMEMITRLAKQLYEHLQESDGDAIKVDMFRITSLLVTTSSADRQLLNCLCLAPVHHFTESTMEASVACWQWLLSARPELSLPFLQEMSVSWQMTVDMKMGLFTPDEPSTSDVLASGGPTQVNIQPHNIWTQFLSERIEIAKYSSKDQVDLLAALFHKCLPSSIGKSSSRVISSNVATVGVRFRLLGMGLSLLQTDGLFHGTVKSVLRERIYASAYEYFSNRPSYPTQKGSILREDILSLVKFFQIIHSDKKYLKTSDFVLGDVNPDNLTSMNLNHSSEINVYGTMRSQSWMNTLSSGSNVSNRKTAPPSTLRRQPKNADSFVGDYMKKRNLILSLLASELERLVTWYNPLSLSELAIPGEDVVNTWRTHQISEKQYREIARLAWDISPALAIYIPSRFKNTEALISEVARLVRTNPVAVQHIPHAINFLVTPTSLESDAPELTHMLTWAPVSPVIALSYFSRQYPPHPLTAQYAVRVLKMQTPETLLFFVPQLVQALRYDSMGYVYEFILWAANLSQVLAHQFIWNMKTNIFKDEDSQVYDDQIGEALESLIDKIKNSSSKPAQMFYEREFDFFFKITDISRIIRPFPKGDERKRACLKALREVSLEPGCYLPSNPEAVIIDIDYNSGQPMQSAAKAPFLAKFKVKKCTVKELEEIGTSDKPEECLAALDVKRLNQINQQVKATRTSISSCVWFASTMANGKQQPQLAQGKLSATRRGSTHPSSSNEYWTASIFKVGDDVRQDMLALQIISFFKDIVEGVGLEMTLFPYRVVATSPGCGVIECVPDSRSRDQIGRQTDIGMYDYFITKYGDESTSAFQTARRNFIMSMAAYSVITFLLQIKDRHNGNIMLNSQGHIIHIDFGFMFESSPGGNMGWEPDFKLNDEMVLIMGGSMEAPPYKWFQELCVRGYLALRQHREAVVSLVSLMLDTGLPCFRGRTIKQLRARFAPNSSEKEAAQYMLRVIYSCYQSFRGKTYDMIQYFQNQIPY